MAKEKKSDKFIIDVVPLTRIPLTRNQSFSYLNDKKLAPGTLVSVPLFRRKLEGIVLGSRSDFHRLGNIELKKIDKIIEENFLTEEQMKLAQFISDYYISPLGIVMKGFVPKRQKRIKNYELRIENKKKNIILTAEQQNAVNLISNFKFKISNFLLYGLSGSGKTEVYIHSIIKLKEKEKNLQFLVLVPEQTLTPQAMERYGAYFSPDEMVLLSSNVTKGQYWSNWQKIKSGEAKIIIGTRMAVFAPFKKLGMVVIDEEQDMSYKQWDMNPRYDARTLAEKMGELYQCPVVFGSATPRLESYYKAMNKNIKLVELPELDLKNVDSQLVISNLEKKTSRLPITNNQLRSIELVDMRKEKWQKPKNYSSISKKLQGEIAYALKNKQQAVLFINRQGMSNFSVCENCKTVLRCPRCDRALIKSNKGNYKCVHCAHETSIIPECSKCHGIAFKNVGLGTQKVEKEIKDIFPGAKILRLDSEVAKKKNSQEEIYESFSSGAADILIGTQMISKGWDLPNVSLVGIIDTDNLFSIPDFSAAEKAFDYIFQVSGRTSRPDARFPGVVIIQTFNPENKTIKWAQSRDFESFFKKELEERKILYLPPYGKIIKLVIQDFNYKKAASAANDVFKMICKLSSEIQVSEPQDAYVSKIRGRFKKQITIKIKSKNKAVNNLVKILKSLPNGWIIDVDPISII
ncbi:MAG TPA: primosomal protein N' [Candidatus Moranbacteria bacterium]|nr:primosomal protein N' [Candidatus Moranbacteria bacterium]